MTLFSNTSLARSTPDILVTGVPCDPGVVAGDWVYLDASSVAQRAIATSALTANVFGLVEESNGSTCTIRIAGISKSIFSGLDTTKEYLLSYNTVGAMTEEGVDVPTAPGHVVLVLGKPFNATQFLIRVGSRMIRS